MVRSELPGVAFLEALDRLHPGCVSWTDDPNKFEHLVTLRAADLLALLDFLCAE